MSGLPAAAALLLAAVFATAGLAKLRRRPATTATFTAFGLPATAATAVPIGELVLGAVLVVTPGWGAVLALGALAAFTTVLARAIRAGVTVGCNCFGTATRAPVSSVELVRNALLAAAALVALGADHPSIPSPAAAAAVAGAALGGVVVLRLLRYRLGSPASGEAGQAAASSPASAAARGRDQR